MDAGKWLRPDVRQLYHFVTIVFAFQWLGMAGFTLYASLWRPDHAILKQTPAEWLAWMAEASLFFATLFALSWLQVRRVAWLVGPEGIAVYRGTTLKRSFAWSEVQSLRLLRFGGVSARLATRPFVERLSFLAVAERVWLREFVKGPLGERLQG